MAQIGIIEAADFVTLIKDQAHLNVLDIRTKLETDAFSLKYQVSHHPLHTIDTDSFSKSDKETYILCKMGPRAVALAEKLAEKWS